MAYTALYRKFRPRTFGEVVGQDHIVQTLKNQIKSGRIGHAYLLTGGRGTGKTSTAKILARAINCLNPKDGEPCNECEICKAMLDGSLTDVVEMDAASNNSVEDIREIKEKVNFLPTLAKYRVYIIDEVHMLSTGAFNALLKTLEEPPEHVKFILATTEPQKLLATILSRCQRFDFKKISNEDMIKRLKIVCKESNIQITEGALNLISVLSEGAARDALSILERCIQDGETDINEDKIKEFVYINNIINGIIEKNIEKALNTVNEVLDEGKDLEHFLWEMIKYTKDVLMYKVGYKSQIYNEEEKVKIDEAAKKASKEELINIIYKLSEAENKMKISTQKTLIFETEIIKLCMKIDIQAIKKENTEPQKTKTVEMPQTIQTTKSIKPVVSVTEMSEPIKEEPKIEKKQEKEIQPTVTLADGVVIKEWQNVINKIKTQGKVMIYTNLINTEAVAINDMTVAIRFKNGLNAFRQDVLTKPENMSILTKEISIICGKPMQIKLEDAKVSNAAPAKQVYNKTEDTKQKEQPEDILDGLDIPINFVEEE